MLFPSQYVTIFLYSKLSNNLYFFMNELRGEVIHLVTTSVLYDEHTKQKLLNATHQTINESFLLAIREEIKKHKEFILQYFSRRIRNKEIMVDIPLLIGDMRKTYSLRNKEKEAQENKQEQLLLHDILSWI